MTKAHSTKETRGVIPDKIMIDDRPEKDNNRTEVGDFDSDTIVGAGKKRAIVIYVNRKIRYLIVDITLKENQKR
ncbi:hypothetical protein [Halonatronum saccharophilum]|uniref:hypothetical protein n=1 Tax=Halonatronum saccharophilum TaxID=150060 RepID=UPI00068698C4|nr:hypothetical protein [Halonatronum saccharophilum]